MTSSSSSAPASPAASATDAPRVAGPLSSAHRPSVFRRIAVVVTGLLACLLPTMWGLASLLQLVSGTQTDHRFHQLTGQGLLLAALWLGGIVPLLVAGWRGRRPSPVAGLAHLGFIAATLLTVSFVPGTGVTFVAGYVVVTGALVWLAVPQRPAMRRAFSGLDPVLAPLAMLSAALFTPFVLGERELQTAMADEHAELTHYFDMSWVSVALVVLAVLAALSPLARRLALLSMLGTALIGAARFAFTPETTWSLAAAGLGLVGAAAAYARLRRS